MEDFNFYTYYEEKDKIKIYCEDIQNFFEETFNIKIESVDFDQNYNVVLYIEHTTNKMNTNDLEKAILKMIIHLNDVEVRNMKIVLAFNAKDTELI